MRLVRMQRLAKKEKDASGTVTPWPPPGLPARQLAVKVIDKCLFYKSRFPGIMIDGWMAYRSCEGIGSGPTWSVVMDEDHLMAAAR